MAIQLSDVQSFIDANKDNKDVQSYVGGFVTADRVNAFLQTDDGKKTIQPVLDSYHAKGLDSWKKNNLSKLVNEEVAKLHPAETDEQKRLKKIEQDNTELQKKIVRAQLKDSFVAQAQKDSFPIDLVDLVIADDEESTKANYGRLKSVFQKSLDKIVQEKFKTNGRTPNYQNGNDKDKGGMNQFIRSAAGR